MINAIWYTVGVLILAIVLWAAWKLLMLGLTLLGILWVFVKLALLGAALWYGCNWVYAKFLK